MKKIILSLIIIITSLCNGAAIGNRTQAINAILFNAVKDNDIETAKQMISAGANINYVSNYPTNIFGYHGFHTSLHEAVIQCNPQMVKLLLESSADVNMQAAVIKPENLGRTPLHFALCDNTAFKIFINNQDIINIAAGEKSIDRNKIRYDIVKLLLEYGAIVPENLISKACDNSSYTDIAKKAISGFISAIGLSGVDEPDLAAKNLTQAVILNDKYVVNLFLIIGSNKEINAKDKFGFTALMWAFARGNLDLAKIILEHCDKNSIDLDFNLTNIDSENALQLAKKHKHHELITLFRNFMLDCMYKSISEKLPKPLVNIICEYSDF